MNEPIDVCMTTRTFGVTVGPDPYWRPWAWTVRDVYVAVEGAQHSSVQSREIGSYGLIPPGRKYEYA
jgi:hypothetical protein